MAIVDSFRTKIRATLKISRTIISVIISYIISSILLAFISFLALLWMCVQISARVFRPDLEEPLDGPSTVFAMYEGSKAMVNILLAFTLDGPVSTHTLRHLFLQRVFPPEASETYDFKSLQRFWTNFLGYPFWKRDTNFQIQNHIRNYDYTSGALYLPEEFEDHDLQHVLGALSQTHWPKSQSPWELLMLPNYRRQKDETLKTVLVLRMDHVLADGYSIAFLWETLLQTNLGYASVHPKSLKLSRAQKLGLMLKVPYDFGLMGYEGVVATKLNSRNIFKKNSVCCFSNNYPNDLIKNVKNHYRVSFSAVLYCIIFGAIQRSLATKKVPEKVTTQIVFLKPNHPPMMKIHAFLAACNMPCKADNAEARLRHIQNVLVKIGESTFLQSIDTVGRLARFVPNYILRPLVHVVNRIPWDTGVPISVSIFPALASGGCFEGIPILDLASAVSNIFVEGISIVSSGWMGQQKIVMTIDDGVPGWEQIARNFKANVQLELDDLMQGMDGLCKKNDTTVDITSPIPDFETVKLC